MRISDWSSDVCSSDLIVLGRQVDGGEIAAHERRGVGRVAAQQFQHAETVALGLECPPVLNRAELADGTVGGAEDGPWRLVQWAGAFFQRSGEERIEMLVGGEVFDQRLGQIGRANV